jgi:hypothetical protein
MEIAQINQNELEVTSVALATREQHEIQSAVVSAKKFPRNENQVFVKVATAFSRASMAESAVYSFPRQGAQVTGPSVDTARELARLWGNLRYGMRIVQADEERVRIRAYCLDLETNAYVEAEDDFAKKIMRKDKRTGEVRWVAPDERDARELVNRRGAIIIRNCILQMLPNSLIEEALATARKAQQENAKADIAISRESVVKEMVLAFNRLGVSVSALESRLGRGLDFITAEELAELRQVHKSIKDGILTREEAFPDLQLKQVAGDDSPLESLKRRLHEDRKEKETATRVPNV